MKIKENDFIEIDYTGRDEKGNVFDTTVKENALPNQNKNTLKPKIVCLGQRQLLKGLDEQLANKEIGSYKFKLKPEDAFGKKDAKKLKLMPLKLFKQQKIRPYVGLDVNVDGQMGKVRSVSAGRTIVDFNHPLSGQSVTYSITVLRKVTDNKEKIKSLLEIININPKKIELKDTDNATVEIPNQLHQEVEAILKKQIKDLVGVETEFKVNNAKSKQSNVKKEK